MRTILVALTLISTSAMATEQLEIVGWKETPGITKKQAGELAREAIHQYIAIDEDGEVCGVEEMWSWERERDLSPFPQQRGEIFAIVGYVRGPHSVMGCSSTETYDCRVVFNKPKSKTEWKVEYVDCEGRTRQED